MQIDLPEDDLQYLNAPAKQQLKKHVDSFIDLLLRESSRLEASQRTTDGAPEINSSMINDAYNFMSRAYYRPKKSKSYIACLIVAMLSTLIAGLIFDFERLKDPLMLVVFMIILAISITFNVIVIIKD